MRFIGCRGSIGCLTESAKITMADLSIKKISDVKVGDFVHNPLTERAQEVVRVLSGPETKPMVHLEVEGVDEPITMTSGHPVVTAYGPMPAKDLREFHTVLDAENNLRKINKISYHHGYVDRVWNLGLEGEEEVDFYFVANGVVSGDLKIQGELEKSTEK